MIIGIIGTQYSGKKTLAKILVKECHFEWKLCKSDHEPSACFIPKDIRELGWKRDQRLVILLDCWQQIEELRKRPFFLLVAVDAPLFMRYHRWLQVSPQDCSLEKFVKDQDEELFETKYCRKQRHNKMTHSSDTCKLFFLMQSASVHILNDNSLEQFVKNVIQLQLDNSERLRPSWNGYFIRIAQLAATRSNCMKRRVGAIIVRDNRIVSTGYNGTPIGVVNCNESGCRRCNDFKSAGHYLDECLCLHAEENAIIEAGRERCKNAILYSNVFPCLSCAKKIVQSGISKVVYSSAYTMDTAAKELLEFACIEIQQVVSDSLERNCSSICF
eukprot:jgi/Galph1/4386/GphlegSOOS_G3091.1